MSEVYIRVDLNWDYEQYKNLARLQYSKINDYFNFFAEFLKNKEELETKSFRSHTMVETIPVEGDFRVFIDDFAEWSAANSAQMVYNALFLSSNSFLEWGLIEICRLASIYIEDDFSRFNNGRGLQKAKNYLKEKLNVKISSGTKEWYRFILNQEVRNLIVHNGANVIVDYSKDRNAQPIYEVVRPIEKEFYKAFLITESGFLYIKDVTYIQESHQSAIAFVQQTLDATIGELVNNRGIKWLR